MNIGQILEVHLGLAAKGIGDKINQMIKEQQELAKLREFLQKVYDLGDTRQRVDISELSDEDVRTLAHNLRAGRSQRQSSMVLLNRLSKLCWNWRICQLQVS